MRDFTRCVIHPKTDTDQFASLAPATFRASTIVYPDPESFARRGERGFDGYTYGLQGTPTTRTLEAQITLLHGGARTILVPSGQAAVTMVMLAVLKPGDEVLIPDHVYPPVRHFCSTVLGPLGIRYRVYDPLSGSRIADLMSPVTRLVWVESPGSGTMEVQDLTGIVEASRPRGVLVGCDNTWATPLGFKPLAHGADFVTEALTKYVGGHSDLLLGSITVADVAWRDRIRSMLRDLGIGVSPDEAHLALRGIETMGVRLAHVGRVAEDFAVRLAERPDVKRVLHPALPSCPGHAHFRRDFVRGSGVFSVVLPPRSDGALARGMSALQIFAIGASWGGTRSLVAPMAVAQDRTVNPWLEPGPLIRISIGLEDPSELWEDLMRMLSAYSG